MSDDVNLRAWLVDALKPHLPATWAWFDHNTNLDRLTTTTVMLNLQTVSRLPEAPLASRLVEYVLTVMDPHELPRDREDPLDDALVDLLNTIDTIRNLRWSRAERGTAADGRNLGFDIYLSFPYTKTETIEGS